MRAGAVPAQRLARTCHWADPVLAALGPSHPWFPRRCSRARIGRWLHLLDGRGWVPERDGTGTEVVSLRTRSMLNYPAHFKGLTNLDKPSASWMVGVA